jgi:hypothetical protein
MFGDRSFQLIEAVVDRLDGAPVSRRRRWSDEFKARAVATTLDPDVNILAAAREIAFRRRSFLAGAGKRCAKER